MRAFPLGTILICCIACGFYGLMLASVPMTERGDAVVGEAMGQLFTIACLWLTLAALLISGGVIGRMPRWAAIAWLPLVPLAAVATFVAIDLCSWRIYWPIICPVVLPVVVMVYALWARFPRLHDRFPAAAVTRSMLGLVLFLSIITLLAGSA